MKAFGVILSCGSILLAGAIGMADFLRVDACMDAGGSFDYESGTCAIRRTLSPAMGRLGCANGQASDVR